MLQLEDAGEQGKQEEKKDKEQDKEKEGEKESKDLAAVVEQQKVASQFDNANSN